MPDTRITRTANGWTDKDTGDFYPCRRVAREQRRARRRGLATTQYRAASVAPVGSHPAVTAPASIVVKVGDSDQTVKLRDTGTKSSLSGLQRRAFNRLTRDFRIDTVAASIAVNTFGYNAAVSYGHLRQAGATHNEAMDVIDRGDPRFSVAYGKQRADGVGHVHAKAMAAL